MKQTIDFREYANGDKSDWSVLLTSCEKRLDTFAERLLHLVKETIYFPSGSILPLIVTNYLITPSALTNIAPILLVYGKEGTGKSSLGILAAKLHNSEIFSASSTFASIRNYLESKKQTTIDKNIVEYPGETRRISVEANVFLVWDDIDPYLLKSEKDLYRLLKNGYNRETSITQISSEKSGVNMKFDCYSLKLLGTVSNLTANDDFKELQRRAVPIHTQPCSDFFSSIDFPLYDWSSLHHTYNSFWNSITMCRRFIEVKKMLLAMDKTNLFTSNEFILSRDLIAIGIVSGLFTDFNEAVHIWSSYWKQIKQESKETPNKLLKCLELVTQEYIKATDTFNREYGKTLPTTINDKELKNHLQYSLKIGEIDSLPLPKELAKAMLTVGFSYQKNDWLRY